MKIYSHNIFDWATCALESACAREYRGPMLALKGGSAPPAPDPYAVSAAQTQSNEQTSAYNNAGNHGNTYTPLGSSTYSGHIDPRTGAMVYDQTVSLAPDQQKLLNEENANSLAIGNTESGLIKGINANSNTPLPQGMTSQDMMTAREQVQNALYNRETQYLDPQYAQEKEQMDTQLANQGILPGSPAYNNAVQNYNLSKNQAYGNARDSAIAGGGNELALDTSISGQDLNQAIERRDAPLNEYDALKSSAQVNIPQFGTAQNSQIAPTNVAGNVYQSYGDELQASNAATQSNNALLGGLIGAGGNVGAAYAGKGG